MELLVFLFLLPLVIHPLSRLPFHEDESQWIGTSDRLESFLSLDYGSALWAESYLNLTAVPVTRYVIGVGRRAGGFHVQDLNLPWDGSSSYEQNVAKNAKPSPQLLWWSRLPMAILAALSGTMAFMLVSRLAGYGAGLVFVLLYACNSYLMLMLCRAMSEGPLLLFLLLGTLAGCRFFQALREESGTHHRKQWITSRICRWLTVCLACFALATATKLNGALVAPVFVLLFWAVVSQRRNLSLHKPFSMALEVSTFAIFIAALTFIAVNPFLYEKPVTLTKRLFDQRFKEMGEQARDNAPAHIQSLPQRLTILPVRILNQYSTLSFPFAEAINGMVASLGFILLLRKNLGWWRGSNGCHAGPCLLLLMITMGIPPLFTPLDWDRYYMLPVFFTLICFSLAMAWGLECAWNWITCRTHLLRR